MKCKRGHEDWYVRGSYRRCKECHRETLSRHYHNQKISSGKDRKQKHKARPLGKDIARLFPAALEKRLMTKCKSGHQLTGENVRLEIDSKGRTHRRCKACDRLRALRKYGVEIPSTGRDMILSTINPWDGLE